jgi:hypothetical protein
MSKIRNETPWEKKGLKVYLSPLELRDFEGW